MEKREWANAWLQKPKKQLLGGEWCKGQGPNWKSINPATQETLAEFSQSNQSDVNRAVDCARQCFESGAWKKQPKAKRAELLREIGKVAKEYREELATLDTLNNGKLFRESLYDDMPDCANVFDYYAGWIDKYYGETCPTEDGFLNYTLKEPVGVCGLIVPWNYPLLLACWKIAPALAMGNSVVVKPSEHTSFSLIRFFELIEEKVDLPAGVLNLVLGDGEVGNLLSNHSGIDKVSFTGSTRVGRKILEGSAASNLKTVTLELGGKSPNIIFEDAPDLDSLIERSFTLMFSHKGEKCTEPTRFVIHESLYDQVAERLVKKCEAVKCGDPFSDSIDQGPQCHQAHFESVMSYIESGKKEGAKVLVGGDRDSIGENEKGYFVRPTIFENVTSQMRIVQEEIFGPVLVLQKFKMDSEAIQMANQTPYGLAAGFWTQDISRAHRMAEQIDAGMIFINRYGCYDFSSPFGGFKNSGWGKEMAIHSLDSYTRTKSVWVHF